MRTLVMVDGSENEIPRRDARQIPFTYVRAHTARARKVLRKRWREKEKEIDR